MSKELEALERLKTAPTFMGGTAEYKASTKSETLLLQDYEIVKQALLELQSIKEAEPSEALECLRNMCNDKAISDYILYNCLDEDIVNIKQSLFKELEQEKVLKELIKLIDDLEPTFNRKGISSDTTILGTIIKDYFYDNVSDLTLSYLLKENQQDEVISRAELCEAVDRIFGSEEKFLDIIEEDLPYNYHYYKYDGEEIYIIDRYYNKYINWYKLTHLGRDFHTDMKTKEEVIDFLQRLHDEWLKENEDE